MGKNTLKLLAAAASGALFALGLVVSGMAQPAKVLGFLNVAGIWNPQRFGAWDASLMFVMGGALCVTLVAFAVTPRAGRKPWFDTQFHLPTRKDIDAPLLSGAVVFGVGWGLVGYCPGPALATFFVGGLDAIIFVACMCLGMLAANALKPKNT